MTDEFSSRLFFAPWPLHFLLVEVHQADVVGRVTLDCSKSFFLLVEVHQADVVGRVTLDCS